VTIVYQWAFAPVFILNPPTFSPNNCDIILPEGHTLRRILVNTPLVYFKRGSVTPADQQMYFINYEVSYGFTADPWILYRSLRTLKEERTVNTISLTDTYMSWHCGADLELGFNEKVQRGGPNSYSQRLRLTWSIYSSGTTTETLVGQAGIGLRALYSTVHP